MLDHPAGPTDPDVYVVAVRSRAGRPIALLANYSLHYVGGVPAGGVSADYFGEFSRVIEQRLAAGTVGAAEGPPPVAMLTNGTSGDVNNINFRRPRGNSEPFERIRTVANYVADAAWKVVDRTTYRSDTDIDMRQQLLTLQRRRPTPEMVRRAREFLAVGDNAKLPRRARPYAEWTVQLAEPPYEDQLVLQTVRIGDLAIAAIPCEVFCEIGLELKDKSPFEGQFTIELANGHYGYLPTPSQHALGGYETWLGTNTLEVNASVKIVSQLRQMLQDLHSKP